MIMPVQCLALIIAKLEGKAAIIFGIALPDAWNVGIVAVFSFSLIFAFWVIGVTAYYVLWTASGKLTNQLNDKALEWTLSPRKNCDIGMTKGEFCYLIKSATDNVSNFVETLFISIIPPLASFVLAIIYIGLIDWVVMLIVIVVSVALLIFAFTRVTLERKLIVNEEVCRGRINNLFLNSVTNLPFLSLFKCQLYEKSSLQVHNNRFYANLKKRTYVQWSYWFFIFLFEYGSMALGVFVANAHAASGAFSISSAVLLVGYILNVYDPIESLGYNISGLQQSAIKINRIKLAKPDESALLLPPKQKVAFDSIERIDIVDFCLRQGSFKLDNINLSFKKGEMVALAGSSGSGKTSIVSALLGLREYKSGRILLNKQLEVESLFFDDEKVSYALQEMQLFDKTMQENIFYPNLTADKFSAHILKSMGLDKLIERNLQTDDGLEQRLSGGEKKRINLARAMIKKAQLYVFDEPTNELDEKNVEVVIGLLKKLKKDAIVIAVTHDSRLLEKCDKVFYF